MPTPTESYQLARENKARLDEGDKRMARIESKVDKYAERSTEQHIEQTRIMTRTESKLDTITSTLEEQRKAEADFAAFKRKVAWLAAGGAGAVGTIAAILANAFK